jgi:hypothetical protein
MFGPNPCGTMWHQFTNIREGIAAQSPPARLPRGLFLGRFGALGHTLEVLGAALGTCDLLGGRLDQLLAQIEGLHPGRDLCDLFLFKGNN